MAPDTMRVRLHLRLIRVLTVLVDTVDRLKVEVTSTWSWSRCPHCGFKTRTVHDTRQRRIRDLPVSGRRTTLVWIRRRFSCANCDERHLETHAEFEGGLTRFLARGQVADAKVMSIRAVVRRHGLDWHLIQALVSAWSTMVAEHRRSRRCRVLWSTRPRVATAGKKRLELRRHQASIKQEDLQILLCLVTWCSHIGLWVVESNGCLVRHRGPFFDKRPEEMSSYQVVPLEGRSESGRHLLYAGTAPG